MMNKTLLILAIAAFLMQGCSHKQTNKTLPISTQKDNVDAKKIAILLKFNEALEFQNDRKYGEAIRIYDSIIGYYRGKEDKGILASVYINKFECSLLINRGHSKIDVEDFLRRFGNNPREMMSFEVLYILDGAKIKSMDSKIEQWTSKYRGQRLDGWTFKYIDDWAKRVENGKVRNRVNRYVSIFKKFL